MALASEGRRSLNNTDNTFVTSQELYSSINADQDTFQRQQTYGKQATNVHGFCGAIRMDYIFFQ
ncbi:MAG: hypothetical protein RLZZ597_283 [Cyanobacteriota bacterium]|jgi:hypothetical protein